jgi:hypothetical protein
MDGIPAVHFQSAIVQSPYPVALILNISYRLRLALPGVYSAYQWADYSLLIINSRSSTLPTPPDDTSPGSISRAREICHENVSTHGVLFCTTELLQRGLTFCATDECNTAINILPDDVLLEIFDLCRSYFNPVNPVRPLLVWKWDVLVHVCKRWRQLVFSSPRRLDLQILCTYGTPVRKNLGIWVAR